MKLIFYSTEDTKAVCKILDTEACPQEAKQIDGKQIYVMFIRRNGITEYLTIHEITSLRRSMFSEHMIIMIKD